jgi:uncharacterized protein (TIGR03437 family)
LAHRNSILRRVFPPASPLPLAAAGGLLASVVALQAQPAISVSSGAIVYAASYASSVPVAPGSIAAAFGSLLVSAPAGFVNLPLPITLGGISLEFANDQLAPPFFALPTQVNFQIPWELSGDSQTSIVAVAGGRAGAPQPSNLAPFAPGIFSLNGQVTCTSSTKRGAAKRPLPFTKIGDLQC